MRLLARAVLAGAFALSSACYDEEPSTSPDVATADMRLYVEAVGDEEATRLRIGVSGPGEPVELGGGDALRAGPSGGALRSLSRTALGYEAVLPPGVTLVDVELARAEPYESAAFAFEIPARTEILLPATAPRSVPLRIEWEPGAGTYLSVIEIAGDCFTTVTEDSPVDPGFYVLDPKNLEPSSGTCAATVTLKRLAGVQVPEPNLGRVDTAVSQSMTATFESVP